MYKVFRENELTMKRSDFEDVSNLHVLEFGPGNLHEYSNVILLSNEILERLRKTDIQRELFDKIEQIVEILTNLSHFKVDLKKRDVDELVEEVVERFKSFKYKSLKEMEWSRDFKIYPAMTMTKEEPQEATGANSTTRYSAYERAEGDRDFICLVSGDTTPRIISIISSSDDEDVLRELINGFQLISGYRSDSLRLKKHVYFSMKYNGFHSEIADLINRYLRGLSYIFNSYSYKKNELQMFDRIEIDMKLGGEISEWITHSMNVAEYQLSSTM